MLPCGEGESCWERCSKGRERWKACPTSWCLWSSSAAVIPTAVMAEQVLESAVGQGLVIQGGLTSTPIPEHKCHPTGCRDPRPPHHSAHAAPAPSPKSPLQSPNWDSKSPHSQHPAGWDIRMRGVRREAGSRDPRGNTARGSAPHRLPRMVGSSSCSGRFPVRNGPMRWLSTNSWE